MIPLKRGRKRLTVIPRFRFQLEDQRRLALGFHYFERVELTERKRHYEMRREGERLKADLEI